MFFYVNVFLNVIVVVLYATSVFIVLRNVKTYEEKNPYSYAHTGWFKVCRIRGHELGVYLIRLVLSACLIMFAMNLWHLFTFTQEATPPIKNLSWRTGNFLVATTFLVLSVAFKNESK